MPMYDTSNHVILRFAQNAAEPRRILRFAQNDMRRPIVLVKSHHRFHHSRPVARAVIHVCLLRLYIHRMYKDANWPVLAQID